MIRQLSIGLAGWLVATLGAIVCVTAPPPVYLSAAAGIALVIIGVAVILWAVGA